MSKRTNGKRSGKMTTAEIKQYIQEHGQELAENGFTSGPREVLAYLDNLLTKSLISAFRKQVANLGADGLRFTGHGCIILVAERGPGEACVSMISEGGPFGELASQRAAEAYSDAIAQPEPGGYL